MAQWMQWNGRKMANSRLTVRNGCCRVHCWSGRICLLFDQIERCEKDYLPGRVATSMMTVETVASTMWNHTKDSIECCDAVHLPMASRWLYTLAFTYDLFVTSMEIDVVLIDWQTIAVWWYHLANGRAPELSWSSNGQAMQSGVRVGNFTAANCRKGDVAKNVYLAWTTCLNSS